MLIFDLLDPLHIRMQRSRLAEDALCQFAESKLADSAVHFVIQTANTRIRGGLWRKFTVESHREGQPGKKWTIKNSSAIVPSLAASRRYAVWVVKRTTLKLSTQIASVIV